MASSSTVAAASTASSSASGKYYVSITGLRLKSIWCYFGFAKHAVPCYTEAMSTEGNVLTDTRQVNGVHHTLTAWESKESMRKFVLSDTHRAAMKAFPRIATGKTYGTYMDHIPDWDEALAIWEEQGKEYGTKQQPGNKNFEQASEDGATKTTTLQH